MKWAEVEVQLGWVGWEILFHPLPKVFQSVSKPGVSVSRIGKDRVGFSFH